MLRCMETWTAARSDVRLLARDGARSPAISSLVLPTSHTPADIMAAMDRVGYLIGGPLDARQQDIIRIGHMGDLEPVHLEALLGVLEGVLA